MAEAYADCGVINRTVNSAMYIKSRHIGAQVMSSPVECMYLSLETQYCKIKSAAGGRCMKCRLLNMRELVQVQHPA